MISFVYEKNTSLKNNHYVPGTDIKIIQERNLIKQKNIPRVMINLAWHISKEIKYYVKNKLNYKGQIVDIVSKKDFQ